MLLGAAYARAGRSAEAVALVKEAISRGSTLAHVADLAEAVAANEPSPGAAAAALAGDPSLFAHPAGRALTARYLERAGQVRQALPHWQAATAGAPELVAWWRRLARAASATGDDALLRAALETQVRLAPEDKQVRADLIRLLGRTGATPDAIRAATEAPTGGLAPGVSAGQLLLAGGLGAEAARHFEAAVAASPADCEARFGLGATRFTLGDPRGAAALGALLRAPVGGHPCRVGEAAALLLARSPRPAELRAELKALLAGGGCVDPAALQLALARRSH